MNWFWYALIGMVFLSVMFLLITKVNKLGVRSELVYVLPSIFAVLFGLIYIFAVKIPFAVPKSIWIFLVLAGLFAVIGNLLMFKSLSLAPNPGYALAIISADVLLVAIASVFIFKSEFTVIKAIGTVLAVVGIILLGLK